MGAEVVIVNTGADLNVYLETGEDGERKESCCVPSEKATEAPPAGECCAPAKDGSEPAGGCCAPAKDGSEPAGGCCAPAKDGSEKPSGAKLDLNEYVGK